MELPQITIDLMGAYTALRPLALFAVGVTVYGVFVFHFYRLLARKDILDLNLSKHNEARHPFLRKTFALVFYMFKSLLVFPLFVFFWFLVMAGLLFLMGRNQSMDSVMLAAMGVVAAIRICSYYNGALSTDIAKILPFALLGIVLIDNSLIRIPDPTDSLQLAALELETMVYYLGGVVAMEFVLRMVSGLFGLMRSPAAGPEPAAKQTESTSPVPERAPPVVPTYDRPAEYVPRKPPVVGAGSAANAPTPEFLQVLERVEGRSVDASLIPPKKRGGLAGPSTRSTHPS